MPHFDDLEVTEACARVLDHIGQRPLPTPIETDVTAALGRIVAEDIIAAEPSPREARSIMDGYALLPADTHERPREFTLVGESAAGRPFHGELAAGQAIRISTGAVVPSNASVVVPQEDTTRQDDRVLVAPTATLHAGTYIRGRGSDWNAGSVRIPRGARIGPPELAMLLALERPRIKVYPRPSVAILSTGDELLEPGMPYKAGGVHSSNGAMLAAQVHHAGGEVITNRVIPDDLSQLTAALSDAANADLILTSGGVSVGDHDHLHDALRGCGATVLFRRVRMRPGRPLTVAACQGALVCALPGNPASSWATFELIARPALRHMAGVPKERARLLQLTVPIAEPVTPLRTRALFLRAMLSNGQAHPLEHQASGNLASLIGADCLVEVPAGDSPVPAGTSLSTYVIGS